MRDMEITQSVFTVKLLSGFAASLMAYSPTFRNYLLINALIRKDT